MSKGQHLLKFSTFASILISMKHIYFTLFLGFVFFSCLGQNSYRVSDVDGTFYQCPWAGGLNSCQFGRMDLDSDGRSDLLVFDRHCNRLLCFLNKGQKGEMSFVYDESYAHYFPSLTDWVVFADYDSDGREDIFTYSKGWAGIMVYRNVSSDGHLAFECVVSPYLTSFQGGGSVNILASNADYPSIVDIDGDGDLDILTFGVLGTFIEKHQNMSMELYGVADSLVFEKTEICWGRVAESEETNTMYLDTCLFGRGVVVGDDYRHRGATIAVRDLNGDGLLDMLLADVDYPGLTLLTNGGTTTHAVMVSQESAFPSRHPVALYSMPVPYFTDLDNDGVDDLLVSPFDPNPFATEGANSIWCYRNRGSNERPDFHLETKSFLQDKMIDFGMGSYPVLVDWDGDGLTDLVVGSIGDVDTAYLVQGVLQVRRTARLSLLRNVGTAQTPIFRVDDRDLGELSVYHKEWLKPAVADLDGDGRCEVLLGTKEGAMMLFDDDFTLLDDDFLNYSYPYSSPFFYDVNGDGVPDLVVGRRDGRLSYYEGSSSDGGVEFELRSDFWGGVDVRDYETSFFGYSVPNMFRYGDEVFLAVGSESGKLFLFGDVQDNVLGVFSPCDERWHDIVEDARFDADLWCHSSLAISDLDADGNLELVGGNIGGGLLMYNGEVEVQPGVAECDDMAMSLCPNPADEYLLVELDCEGCVVEVRDLYGRLLKRQSCGAGSCSIYVGDLSSGAYMLVSVDGVIIKNALFIKR